MGIHCQRKFGICILYGFWRNLQKEHFYAGGKLKVGGFFSGEVIVNGENKTDQVITGTIEMEAVGGINITKNFQIGADWTWNDENNRNESQEYDQDGSRFTNSVFNIFLNISFSL